MAEPGKVDSIKVLAEDGVSQRELVERVSLFEESMDLGDYLVGLDTYDANVADRFDYQVVATVADGVELEQARSAVPTVTDAYPLADVQDVDEYTTAQGSKADMILNLMYVLLGLAVFIALLGTSLGLVIGTGFGWAIVRALDSEGLTTIVLPLRTLAVLTVVGAIAGVAAAIK